VSAAGPPADPDAVARAHDLLAALLGVLGTLGPHAVAVSVHRLQPRPLVRCLLASDQALDAVAEDRALGERAVRGAAGGWWREARGTFTGPDVVIVARGPSHGGAPPDADAVAAR
jgi:hypothetical protein